MPDQGPEKGQVTQKGPAGACVDVGVGMTVGRRWTGSRGNSPREVGINDGSLMRHDDSVYGCAV